MNIKKALKKESFKRKRDIVISVFIMVFMTYFVTVLTNNDILTGFDSYFSFFYVIIISFLLLINILRILSEEKISFKVKDNKLKINGGYINPSYLMPLDKIIYVDVEESSSKDFNVLLVTKKSHRKKYKDFNSLYVAKNKNYASTLEYLRRIWGEEEHFSCIEIKKSGARKYYLLYIIYKSGYDVEFSKEAIAYIKDFIKEYKL